MDKREVAAVLEEIAFLLDLSGENPFKSRAYQNAARALQALDRDLSEMVAQGELNTIKGVGKSIAEAIAVLVSTGTLPYYEELRARTPEGLRDLLQVPGLGPKRARELNQRLGIASLDELEAALRSDTLGKLPGFGPKLRAKVLEGIALYRSHSARFLLSRALEAGEAIHERIAAHPAVLRSQLAGSLRRRCETVGDLDLVVATDDPTAVMDSFVTTPYVDSILVRGDTKSAVRLSSGMQVDLRAVNDRQYPFLLHHSTGSKDHNVALRGRALARGLKINEYGLWKGDELIPCADEVEFFGALGLAYIPPELREDRGEIEAAERGELPHLLELGDLQGVLHTHSVYSDGRDTIRDMAIAARDRGYRYIGLTDHSQTAVYARGMRPDEVQRQHDEIDRLNGELDGIVILKGTECDILADGSLDYPEDILARFDFVIGSVHGQTAMPEPEMTRRVLTAIENPYLDVLGHATGRLLLARPSYAIDLEAVLQAAAERGVVVEINAHPTRLDIDWRHVRAFRDRGGWVSIHPDAHSVDGLDDVRYGVSIARKGWVTHERVLNALPLDEIRARFRARRQERSFL